MPKHGADPPGGHSQTSAEAPDRLPEPVGQVQDGLAAGVAQQSQQSAPEQAQQEPDEGLGPAGHEFAQPERQSTESSSNPKQLEIAASPEVCAESSDQHSVPPAAAGAEDVEAAAGAETEQGSSLPADGLEELLDEAMEGEPPVVQRLDQWKLRPASGRGRGRGRGKGRGGRNGNKVVEISDSGDEFDVDKGQEPSPPATKRPRAKAKGKATNPKAKAAAATQKAKPAGRKRKSAQISADGGDGASDAGSEKAEDNLKQKDAVAWKVISSQEGLLDVARNFGQEIVDRDGAHHGPSIEAAEAAVPDMEDPPHEPEKPRKRARPGESEHGPSFARRPCPKNSPSSHRWVAIRDAFEAEIFPVVSFMGLKVSDYQAGSSPPVFIHRHVF